MLRLTTILLSTLLLGCILAAGGLLLVFVHYGKELPDYHQLAHYEPPITTRVFAGDGRLVSEYAIEKRTYMPLDAMPQRVIQAFLSAEDKNFYQHSGVDFSGIARAVLTNLKNLGDRRPVGASTITQQVAKNFLLTNEVSIERKIKEAILAFRLERTYSKKHILELYLNEIYLGSGSYGVAAAAMNYFNKSLDELSVAEAAFLGGLPKAPSTYNPVRNYQAAKERRDWVIGRMYEDGVITKAEYEQAVSESIVTRSRDETELVSGADFFVEDIRREIVAKYGETALYKGGLSVRSTLDPELQEIANHTLRTGLIAYDRRHGWRGPVAKLPPGAGWAARLSQVPLPKGLDPWQLAVVTNVADQIADIGFVGGVSGRLPLSEMKWARRVLEGGGLAGTPKKASDLLAPGDVIIVEAVSESDDGKEKYGPGTYALRQIPKVDGAVVAIDPHTGRILAMTGGFSREKSEFNRASQALRQPGSSFKPFVYLAALDNGYTPSSLILDAPIELPQGPGLPMWKPKNYSDDFLGPTTLRVGIEKSRNLMTVRLANALGMDLVADYAKRFGIADNMPKMLSSSLGSIETTPVRMTAAYAMLVNGGKKITPTLIDRIQDRAGKTVYTHDQRACEECQAAYFNNQEMPRLPDTREQLTDPVSAYQMVSILEGVVQRGTGRKIAELGRPLAGKTGTSNDSKDTWFVGFSPDLTVGVFVGFDEPASLGDKETGGSVAAPVFKDFMAEALKDKPITPFRVPPGVRLVRVNAETGKPAEPGDKHIIFEAFKEVDPAPGEADMVIEGEGAMTGLDYGDLGGLNAADEAAITGKPQPTFLPAGGPTTPPDAQWVTPAQPAPVLIPAPSPAAPARTPAQAVPQAGGLY